MSLKISQYVLGNTITVLMTDAPSSSNTAAFLAAIGSIRPLQILGYELDIGTSASPAQYPNVKYADIYFIIPLTWTATYGTDNIRLFRIHDSPHNASVLNASLNSTTATTAMYWATSTDPSFSRFSPGDISPASTPTPTPTFSPTISIGNDGGISDSGGGAVIAAPVVEPKTVVVQKNLRRNLTHLRISLLHLRPAYLASHLQLPQSLLKQARKSVLSSQGPLQLHFRRMEPGQQVFLTGEKGPLPVDAILPPSAKTLGAVADGVAVTMASGGSLEHSLGRSSHSFSILLIRLLTFSMTGSLDTQKTMLQN